MTSALSSVAASLGFGSKVCELVPSGTTPVMVASVPPAILAMMLVIGATVVAMLTAPSMTDVDTQLTRDISESPDSEEVPQAAIVAISMNIPALRRIKITV